MNKAEELKNCSKTVTLIRPKAYIVHSPEAEDILLTKMFFRHHNRSPDCESYIRRLFLFCNQNIAIVWLGGKSADGGILGECQGAAAEKNGAGRG